jgi:hypothetical protein
LLTGPQKSPEATARPAPLVLRAVQSTAFLLYHVAQSPPMKGLMMAHKSRIDRTLHCLLKRRHFLMVAVFASAALNAGQSAAQPPAVTLTQIGSPIWRPADFQLFSAPVEPDAAFRATSRALEPLAPLGPGEPYTTPHGPPYETELSTNAAGAGFVNRSLFPREAIMGNPYGIFFAHLLLPDPGITGSSRDFASGPVIPNSLFPMAWSTARWKDGAVIYDPPDSPVNVRPTDQPFEGMSHRTLTSSLWYSGDDYLGNYEFRSSLRDTEGNGWDIVAPFRIVAELPPGDFNQDGAVDAADYVIWRKTDVTQTGYDTWRANFGTSLLAGSGSALPSAEPLSAVPEPSTLMIACIAAIGVGAAARRRKRQGALPCIA